MTYTHTLYWKDKKAALLRFSVEEYQMNPAAFEKAMDECERALAEEARRQIAHAQ